MPGHVRRNTQSVLGISILGSSACLAGWPDHPRRAVDQKREQTVRADPPRATGRVSRAYPAPCRSHRRMPTRAGRQPFLNRDLQASGQSRADATERAATWPLDASHPRPGACDFQATLIRRRSEALARELQRQACGGHPSAVQLKRGSSAGLPRFGALRLPSWLFLACAGRRRATSETP